MLIDRNAVQLPQTIRRRGFTLVELLVAAGLSMFIMYILATAFTRSIDTFRHLRSVGNMQENLRMAMTVIKRDLAAEHFGGSFQPGYSGPFLSDQRLDQVGWLPPEEGYFYLRQNAIPVIEGGDGDGIWSTRNVSCEMAMTVKLSGAKPDEVFYAKAPATIAANPAVNMPDYYRPMGADGILASRWAEVRYFLVVNGQNANGMPLYTLYRRQRVILPTNTNIAVVNVAGYPDLSVVGGPAAAVQYNTPTTVTTPANRVAATALTGNDRGDDILLGDVLSFEIKPYWTTGPASTPTTGPGAITNNHDYPFDNLPISPANGVRSFDTWSRTVNTSINWDDPNTTNPNSFRVATGRAPLRIRITAIQIKIRIWDAKAQQARQVTFLQDV